MLERWPVKLEGEHLILGSEWAAWEGDLRFLGFDRPEVLGRLQSAQVQISAHVDSTTEERKSTLRGACHKAAELFPKLASLLHESESNFQKDMKTLAPSLAKTQTTIRTEYAACSKFSGNNLGVALGAELGELAEHAMGAIQYFVGVYTALLFYRSPDTWAPRVEVAKKGKESLVKALSSLNDNKYASAFEGMCAHTVVKQMRRDAQTPAREGLHQVEGGPARKKHHKGSVSAARGRAYVPLDPKRNPTSDKNHVQNLVDFSTLFLSIFVRSWFDFPPQLTSQSPPTSTKNRCQGAIHLGLQFVIDF